jgi:diadenosine tetraphosphatase ApaH/serine/threonine PP2A family protein phosphatase
MVGYGGDPVPVVELIMKACTEGAIALRGNHDAMALQPPPQIKTLGDSTALWTHKQLKTDHLEWMDSLPLTAHLDTVLLVHASADMPQQWHYVHDGRAAAASLNAAQAWPGVRYVLGGHVHEQSLYYRGATDTSNGLMKFSPQPGVAVPVPRHRQWLATVGSVGQPRDGNPASMYTLLDTTRAQVTFFRVPYDAAAAAASVRRAGLPDFFAQRLESGI